MSEIAILQVGRSSSLSAQICPVGYTVRRRRPVLRRWRRWRHRGLTIVRRSAFYESAPVPVSDQPWYVNGVAEVATALQPAALLAVLHETEREFGRERRELNAARVMDLDIVAYGRLVRDDRRPSCPIPGWPTGPSSSCRWRKSPPAGCIQFWAFGRGIGGPAAGRPADPPGLSREGQADQHLTGGRALRHRRGRFAPCVLAAHSIYSIKSLISPHFWRTRRYGARHRRRLHPEGSRTASSWSCWPRSAPAISAPARL